ncbi:hypothetical protein ACETU7_10575 [Rhodococcus sp. 3Y1]
MAESALTRARRISDLAVGALEAVGSPKSVVELVDLLKSDRSERSIERALRGRRSRGARRRSVAAARLGKRGFRWGGTGFFGRG